MDVNEHKRLYNITLRQTLKKRSCRKNTSATEHPRESNIFALRHTFKYRSCRKNTNATEVERQCKQHYTYTQSQVQNKLVVRKNMYVSKRERLSNITLRNKLK